MAGRLAGKVAIVTGAGSQLDDGIGNGRATAILFAREGAKVLLVDRKLAAAEVTHAAIAAEGGESFAFEADVTRSANCEAMVAAAVERWGRLDILQNNVGISGRGNVLTVEEEYWDRVMATNVKSMVLTSKFAIPAMLASGGGAITNISSIAAVRPSGITPYSASKGAVESLTKAMAVDHSGDGIRVNAIEPGPVYTPMVYAGGMTDELRERRRNSSLLKVEGTAWDVAHAAVFLASDEARYITGIILPVDGGVSLAGPSRR